MFARVDFANLTLMDALDLACLIELEALKRYTMFAAQLGHRDPHDAAAVFRSMAENEKKHGEKLARRRHALYGDAPRRVKIDDIFDVEAPDVGATRWNMSARKAFEVALESEKKAFAFYDEALPHVSHPEVKALFEELRAEEVEHVEMVEGIMAKLPAEALREREDEDAL